MSVPEVDMVKSVLLFGPLLLALAVPAWPQADPSPHAPRTISVSGIGRVSARPDLAEIQVGVVTQAPTAAAALASNNEAMNRLFQLLKEQGVEERDVQTIQIQIMPQYSQPLPPGLTPQPARGRSLPAQPEAAGLDPEGADPDRPGPNEFVPRIVGYRVENAVEVTARQINKLGPLLDALVQGGANQIRGIGFRVEKGEALLESARRLAMEDARRRAQTLAESAGVEVGMPLRIEEQGGGIPPIPRPFAATMARGAAPAMPVAPGELDLSVTVSVLFELKAGPK